MPRVLGDIELKAKVLEASKSRACPPRPKKRSSTRATGPEMLFTERRKSAGPAEPALSADAAPSNRVASRSILAMLEVDRGRGAIERHS